MVQEYCWVCGERLTERMSRADGTAPYCEKCGRFRYPMYNTAVSMIVRESVSGKILLIKQNGKPFFVLVAGYVNRGEALGDAVSREMFEETGLRVTEAHFNRSRFFEPSNTLMCNFTAIIDDESELHTNYEIDSFCWFTPDEARQNIKANSLASEFLNSYLDEQTDF